MFSGTFRPKLDDKGRLFLPAKFREAMGDGLVITRGQERSIDVRTKADFEVFTQKF
jgi:MraZ protein